MNAPYRIRRANGTFLNTGTEKSSWFNLEDARKKVNREEGEQIVESDGSHILWEVL